MNKKGKGKNPNAFGRKDDTILLTEQKENIVIKVLTLGQSFLTCELFFWFNFCHPCFETGALLFGRSVFVHLLKT